MVNETWANDSLNDAFFNIPGYEVLTRKDRVDTTSGIGGGLLIYAKTDLAGSVAEYTDSELDDFVQCSAVKIPIKGKSEITLVLLYRPHQLYKDTIVLPVETSKNNVKLCRLLTSIPKPYVIVGDLNYSQIDWRTLKTDSSTDDFVGAVQVNFLSQHIDFPTHNSGTQPDVVLSSCESLVLDAERMCHLGASDHSMVMVTVAGSLPSNSTTEDVPDWGKADLSKLREEVMSIEWERDMQNMDTLNSWEFVKSRLASAENNCVPKKRRRTSNKPLWMQQNVMRTIRRKKRLWATYQKTKEFEEYQAYKRVERETRRLVRQAKKKFERKLAKEAKRKPKMFYSYLNSKMSNRHSVGPLKDGETVVSSDEAMANVLNKFFASVFTVENPELPESLPSNVTNKLCDVSFPEETVTAKIDALKSDAAPGPDKIRPRLLKSVSDVLCKPLSIVFMRSLNEGVVPEDWRIANVTSIFKCGSKMSPGNYRPVSLTSIICKIMESIIRDNIVAHLVANELLHSSQHGFTNSKSCQTNLLEYLDTLTKLVDQGYNVDVIYLDFAKAFDKVPHLRLLQKLESCGVSGHVLTWIGCWLSDRKQRVVLNGHESEWLPVTSGVPQGSVLSPVCFVIFINDIDDALDLVNGFVFKFADDTKCGRIINDDQDRAAMQADINRLLEWAEKWQMDFNKKKCKIMHFGNSNPRFSYHMGGYAPGGIVVEEVHEEKDLGVMISDTLKPGAQCAKAAKKANSVLGQMSRAFHFRDKVVWIRLYKTFVRPHLEFCVQAWCPWYKKDIELLENVQKRAVNMVTGLRSNSYEDKLKELNLPSLQARRTRGDMIQVWKYLHGVSLGGRDLLRNASHEHDRETRHTANSMNLARCLGNLELRKNFFTSRCVDGWNCLPADIQSAENLNLFKDRYDRYMSDSP